MEQGQFSYPAYQYVISRIARIVNGECFIGMKKVSMIPLIAFDAVVNVYLTILFLIPLKSKLSRECSNGID